MVKFNKWFDELEEPKRFLVFMGIAVTALIIVPLSVEYAFDVEWQVSQLFGLLSMTILRLLP